MASSHRSDIWYRQYETELDLPSVMRLVGSELSEPYIIYTYRYFLANWCVSVKPENGPVNALKLV